MLNVVLTFDYEIFFGKNNATETDILFKPTSRILDLLDKSKLTGTFFADVCSVNTYKKENMYSDYPRLFNEQIREMAIKGHDVQLHIHSHWITAKYDQNQKQWRIDPRTYRIHHFLEENNGSANRIIQEGIQYLTSTIKEVDEGYQCYAYRAGGYCIQPETELFHLLAENGIEIDSSVCIGKKLQSEAHDFDYDKQYKQLNWRTDSGIIEIPIGSTPNSLFKRMIPSSGYRTLDKEPAKGEGIQGTTAPSTSKIQRVLNFNKTKREFGLEFIHYKQLMAGLRRYYDQYSKAGKDVFVATNCHPKSMDSISMQNMELFFHEIEENGDWVRFVSMKEARNKLKGAL